jgi:D-alanyl-D-alanine carboxypeptidase/D-alanyl-D-alanine-endopeptidase (penicillin-binding protein 4)
MTWSTAQLSFLTLFFALPTLAFTTEWKQTKIKEIEQILSKSKVGTEDFGILIWGGESGRDEVFGLNATKNLIPASVTKLITAATVMRAIPPGTKVKTQILSVDSVEKSVLKGDLYLKGAGDPSFVSETLWFLVNAFTRNKISTIEGDLIVDDSLFDNQRFDSSRQKERVDRAYDAPTGAMSFNWNSSNVFVRPGKKVGDLAQVILDPENEYLKLDAQVRTVAGSSNDALMVDRLDLPEGARGDKIVVRGKIGINAEEKVIFKNITQPDLWAGENLKSFLKQRGITVTGKVKTGRTPVAAKIFAEAESKPIESMLADMNKFSNNYVAEMLTKNLAVFKGDKGSIENGMKHMRSYLAELGHEESSYVLENPSGLTRDNRFSAKLLMSVIADMRAQFQFQPEFTTSLPIAAVDGTLKNRMRKTSGERWVRGKTGYLTGVISLAGYAGLRSGSVLSFVFIYNGKADEWKVRQTIDDMVLAIMN